MVLRKLLTANAAPVASMSHGFPLQPTGSNTLYQLEPGDLQKYLDIQCIVVAQVQGDEGMGLSKLPDPDKATTSTSTKIINFGI